MAFHLVAYYGSIGVGSAFSELSAVPDQTLAVNPSTQRVYSSASMQVFGAYLGGGLAASGRIYTPWKLPNEIRPINRDNVNLETTGYPTLASWLPLPMLIPSATDIIFDARHDAGGVTDIVGLIWLTQSGLEAAPRGERLTLRGDAHGVSPPTPFTWSEIALNWEYDLPPSLYAIVGSECCATKTIAHRWILDNTNNRPGAMTRRTLSDVPHPYQLDGALGAWGSFYAPVMPRLEVLSSSSPDSDFAVFLQVIKLDLETR